MLFALAPGVAHAELTPDCDPSPEAIFSPYEMNRLKQISEVLDEVEAPPFAKACHEPPGLLRGRPETGLFRRSLPETDAKGHSTREFLKELSERAISDLEGEKGFLEAIDSCLRGKENKSSDVCAVVFEWESSLAETVRGARIDLALSINASQYDTLMKKSGHVGANHRLDAHGTFKKENWKPLDKSETELTATILRDYQAEAASEAEKRGHKPGSETYKRFVSDAILGARLKNWANYAKVISTHPVLQYITTSPVDRTELLSAVKNLRSHLDQDIKMAKDKLQLLQKAGAPIYGRTPGLSGVQLGNRELLTPTDALALLDFTPQLETLLLEKPEYCGLATSLVFTKDNRKLGNQLALGIPIAAAAIALPFFTPWIVGASFGAAAGGVAVLETKLERDQAFHRFLTVLEHESSPEETTSSRYQDLARADKEFKVSLFLPPAGAILGGAGKTIEVTKSALNIGARMSSRVKDKLRSKKDHR